MEKNDYYVEWWNDDFRGSYHKVPNLAPSFAKRLFTLAKRKKATKAVLGNSRGIIKEWER